uniref:Transmembrane protein n=1 Tax=Pithovirus LCPAC404 TaxID=2506597 RepID=A0A481ZBM3_9VIRU|nr:MAG: uncharacterized protein LCPAC404_00370 [Pithovirus LCPAC404]
MSFRLIDFVVKTNMTLSTIANFTLITVGILLIITASLGINIYNRCPDTAGDQAAAGEKIYFVFMLVIGILIFLFVPLMIFYCHNHTSSKLC